MPITSDKGLCGGINTSVVKYTKVVEGVAEDSGSAGTLFVVGEKGRAQLARGATAQKLTHCVVDTSKSKDGISFAMASMVADSLLRGGYDKLQVIYNRFQSVIAFKPTVATLLSPSVLEAAADEGGLVIDSYEVEGPDRSEFLLDLSEFQLAATLYNAMLENSTSELGSRMQSMENSTKNAGEMLSKLTLYYNRTRQAAITCVGLLACLACLLPHGLTRPCPFPSFLCSVGTTAARSSLRCAKQPPLAERALTTRVTAASDARVTRATDHLRSCCAGGVRAQGSPFHPKTNTETHTGLHGHATHGCHKFNMYTYLGQPAAVPTHKLSGCPLEEAQRVLLLVSQPRPAAPLLHVGG